MFWIRLLVTWFVILLVFMLTYYVADNFNITDQTKYFVAGMSSLFAGFFLIWYKETV